MHDALAGAGQFQPPRRALRADEGMVLLEAALAIPLLVMVALLGVGVARVAVDEMAVVAAARDAALVAGRGGSAAAVAAEVHRRLPRAAVAVSQEGAAVAVAVSLPASNLPWLGAVKGRHEAVSVAAREPGLP